MSDLPVVVSEAGLLFQRASISGDPEAMQRVIDWGHRQIDASYPDDPIRAPLNVIRRLRAHQEWDKVIRTAGKDLRGTIANAIVRDLEFDIQRRQEDIIARDAERRRQEAVLFDAEIRHREQVSTATLNQRIAQEQMHLQHQLEQAAAENDAERRMMERAHETDQVILERIAEAITRALGPNPTDTMIEAAQRVGREITAIRANPSLTDDDKHLQIQILIQTLPRVFTNLRPHDV